MTNISKALAKGTIATVAAGAMAMASATPAAAQDRHRDRGNGISTGEVIAGAVILGGIAAVIASSNNNRRDRDYRYRDNDRARYNTSNRSYDRGYTNSHDRARVAVDECVRTAERQAQRWSGYRAEVYEIRDVDRERGGFEIKGRIAVRDGYNSRNSRGDYRRGNRNAGWDEGRFTCDWRNGRVVDLDFKGIRAL